MNNNFSDSKNTEIELKFNILQETTPDITSLEFWKNLRESIKIVNVNNHFYNTIYYDTASLSLRDSGIVYRIRTCENGSYEATVKSNTKSQNGLSLRQEINIVIAQPIPSTGYFVDTEIFAKLKAATNSHQLLPLFTTSFKREAILIEHKNTNCQIEVALDIGHIETKAGLKENIREIELELKNLGNIDNDTAIKYLQTIGNFMQQHFLLMPSNQSKFSRGLILYHNKQ